jgi:hypothetical protein
LAPITPIVVAEMSHHHPSLQLVPTDTPSTDIWADEILAGKFEILQRVKSAVNKSVRDCGDLESNDLKQLELVLDLSNTDEEVQKCFNIFRKKSEINEFFQTPAVHLLSSDDLSDFKNLKVIDSSNFRFGVFKTGRQVCPRCRLSLSSKIGDLCERCDYVVNQIS